MIQNPDFERKMLDSRLDVTRISNTLPNIDSEMAVSIIDKCIYDFPAHNYLMDDEKSKINNLFEQKLIENLYSFLNDESKHYVSTGGSYGRY